ncbi:MAG: hypothetical protein J6W74_05180 [Bacteroidales bacterium]|nr:hypothetical protein [Bacteroidales bacterium]
MSIFRNKYIIPLLLIFVMISGIKQWFVMLEIPLELIWAVEAIIIWIFAKSFLSGYRTEYKRVRLYILWVLVSAVYGIFMSEGYWDYKSLISFTLFYLLPLSVDFFSSPERVRKCLKYMIVAMPIVFIIFAPLSYKEGISRIFYPIALLVLFYPRLEAPNRIYLFIVMVLFLVFGEIGSRASIIRIFAAFLLGLFFFLSRKHPHRNWVPRLTVFFYLLPIILFCFGTFGSFNIFATMESSYGGDYYIKDEVYEDYEADIAGDTRTFIYREVMTSAVTHEYVIQGHSLARGYESEHFGELTDNISKARGERPSCEVGIMNVFTHMGLIGVILYTILFVFASVTAIRKSKSNMMRVLGCWLAFRWALAWIEEFSYFDINNILIWMAVGMCLSPQFHRMNDKEAFAFIDSCFLRISFRSGNTNRRFRSLNNGF